MDRPLVLLSNDDGVLADGLARIRDAMEAWADVWVVAPQGEQSATSHAITLSSPLRHSQVSERVHAIQGTPADCVYLALHMQGLLPRRPDLVVSGINQGLNLGMDVIYSGTVAAAREAAMRGFAAVAVSADPRVADLAEVAQFVQPLLQRLVESRWPAGQPPLLNINVPPGPVRGVRATRLGRRDYVDGVVEREDPRGRMYYWIGGPVEHHEGTEGVDTASYDAGYVSVTPLSIELTHPDHFGIAAYVAGPDTED